MKQFGTVTYIQEKGAIREGEYLTWAVVKDGSLLYYRIISINIRVSYFLPLTTQGALQCPLDVARRLAPLHRVRRGPGSTPGAGPANQAAHLCGVG